MLKEFLASKKAQLGMIELKYWFIGLLVGIILALAAVYMANHGILLPFKLSFLCPAPAA